MRLRCGVRRASRPDSITESDPPILNRRHERNDVRQYDDLAQAWWDPYGPFAMLQWIAEARSALVPPAGGTGGLLVDLGCGGGLMAPHVAPKGYRHVGVDLVSSALDSAAAHGVTGVRGDVAAVPLADDVADVVCAGEILEHVADIEPVVGEACRILKPGGLLIVDTLADTLAARFLAVTVAERIPGGAPPGIHDPALFVNRRHLVEVASRHGVGLRLRGLRPSFTAVTGWAVRRRVSGGMVPTRSTAVLFQGWGRKIS